MPMLYIALVKFMLNHVHVKKTYWLFSNNDFTRSDKRACNFLL